MLIHIILFIAGLAALYFGAEWRAKDRLVLPGPFLSV